MRVRSGILRAIVMMLFIVGATCVLSAQVQAQDSCPVDLTENGVCPMEVPGNYHCVCEDDNDDLCLDYPNGFKIDEEVFSGVFEFRSGEQGDPPVTTELFGNAPSEADAQITAWSDGNSVGWSINFFPLNAVLVKGGPDSNAYLYWGPDLFSDAGLVAPINASRSSAEVSHVEFCFPSEVTYVHLADFRAVETEGGVTISWATAVELDNAGFNLYRSDSPDGDFVQINSALIASKGNSVIGASYTFVDSVGAGVYWYKLEDIDSRSVKTMHDPIAVIVGGENLFIPTLAFSVTGISPTQE